MTEVYSYTGHRSRLRSRFEKSGFNGFSDYEVLELLLTLCIPRRDVKQPAKDLIAKFGSLRGVLDANINEIKNVKGVGDIAAISLSIIKEASSVYLKEKAEASTLLNSIDKLIDFWRVRLGSLKEEVFEVAFLDNGFKLLNDGVRRIQIGDVDRVVVFPRTVLKIAIELGASGIVLAHNHPSGNLNPSREDIQLTSAIKEGAKTIGGLRVIDHVIISESSHFSFKRENLL